jgi:uncharacterized protein VirK/YbjX
LVPALNLAADDRDSNQYAVFALDTARASSVDSEFSPGSHRQCYWVLASVYRLVCQRHRFYSSPNRLAELLWGFATSIRRQPGIFRLLRAPIFAGFTWQHPFFPFKYLSRCYLVRGLSSSERATSFIHNYRTLNTLFAAPLLRKILYEHLLLIERPYDGHRFAFLFSIERTSFGEGELELGLEVDNQIVYTLQFTIVPGWVVQSNAPDVLLVSRLQGRSGCYDQIRLATKAFLDIAPPALLLAVLHGVAKLCGIEEMVGVSATSQLSFPKDTADCFRSAYDDFWLEIGASKITPHLFSSPIPPRNKSLDDVRNGHKARTRKKRELKRQIAHDVFLSLLTANQNATELSAVGPVGKPIVGSPGDIT